MILYYVRENQFSSRVGGFFINNYDEVVTTPEFKRYMVSDPTNTRYAKEYNGNLFICTKNINSHEEVIVVIFGEEEDTIMRSYKKYQLDNL